MPLKRRWNWNSNTDRNAADSNKTFFASKKMASDRRNCMAKSAGTQPIYSYFMTHSITFPHVFPTFSFTFARLFFFYSIIFNYVKRRVANDSNQLESHIPSHNQFQINTATKRLRYSDGDGNLGIWFILNNKYTIITTVRSINRLKKQLSTHNTHKSE